MNLIAYIIGYSVIITFITLLFTVVVSELLGEKIIRHLKTLGVWSDFIKRYLTKK